MNRAQCTNCQEPTKIKVGFWDGRDKNGRPTSGFLYDCNNTDCPIKQEAMKAELKAELVKALDWPDEGGLICQR